MKKINLTLNNELISKRKLDPKALAILLLIDKEQMYLDETTQIIYAPLMTAEWWTNTMGDIKEVEDDELQ